MNIEAPADVGVPAADSTGNLLARDVGGNKTDALVEAVGTTKSLMAYLKGVIQELAQRGTAKTARVQTTGDSLADVLNITDKGVLTGITVYPVDAEVCLLKVTVDGTVIYAEAEVGRAEGAAICLCFNHRFDTSLRVEHRTSNAIKTVRTTVMYTID